MGMNYGIEGNVTIINKTQGKQCTAEGISLFILGDVVFNRLIECKWMNDEVTVEWSRKLQDEQNSVSK